MKVILAFDKFKDCLSANALCEIATSALKKRFGQAVEVVSMPMSDGGEGMHEILSTTYNGRTNAPRFVETARWCGLAGLPDSLRDPSQRSSYPLGVAIAQAIRENRREIVVGLGGSSTNDAGMGMLQALGYKFIGQNGGTIGTMMCGALLPSVKCIVADSLIPGLYGTKFTAICDVDAPLYGPHGAAYIFAPQKGAPPAMVKTLDAGLRHIANVAGDSAADSPGDGAAGGIGFAMRHFLKARMLPGAEYVMEAYSFDREIESASLIITGEGSSDSQTLMGKVPAAILAHGLRAGIPVCLISGAVSDTDALYKAGFTQIIPITPEDMPLQEAVRPDIASRNLTNAILNSSFPHLQ